MEHWLASVKPKLRTDAECELFVAAHKNQVVAEQLHRNTRISEIWRRRKNAWGATAAQQGGGRDPDIPGVFSKTTKKFKAPFIGDMIRRSQAIIATKLPTAKVVAIPDLIAQEEADRVGEWFNLGFWPRSLKNHNWFAQGTDAFANDAEVVYKMLDQADTWASVREDDEDDDTFNARTKKRKHDLLPIVIDHVATNTYYPVDTDDDGISEVWEITRRKKRYLIDKYELTDTTPGANGGLRPANRIGEIAVRSDTIYPSTAIPTNVLDSAEFIEVWTSPKGSGKDRIPGQYFYLADGFVVKSGTHGYLRHPYYHAYFSDTSSHEPGFETESIVDPMVELQDKIEDLITAVGNVIWTSGFPTLRLRLVNEELVPPYDKDGKVNIIINPGGVLEGVPMGYIGEWMPAPEIGANALPYQELLMKMLDRMSLAPILYAHLESQMSTPVATTLIAIAKAIFGPGLSNFARMFDEMAQGVQYIIANVIKEDVPVYAESDYDDNGTTKTKTKWLTLGPDDMKKSGGYFAVTHSLEPIIPMEQAQTTIMNENLFQNGLLGPIPVLEGAGYGSASQILEDRMVWDGMHGATFQQMFSDQFMRSIQQDKRFIPPGTPPALPAGPAGPVPQMQSNVPPGAEIPMPMAVGPNGAVPPVPGGPGAPVG